MSLNDEAITPVEESLKVFGDGQPLHPVAVTYGIAGLYLPGPVVQRDGTIVGWRTRDVRPLHNFQRCQYDFQLMALNDLGGLLDACEAKWPGFRSLAEELPFDSTILPSLEGLVKRLYAASGR